MISNETGALYRKADSLNPEEIGTAFSDFSYSIGKPDALVCNAGISEQKMFQDISDADWINMFEVNIMGAVRAVRAALPAMLENKAGSIVLIASVWGEQGASCESHYAASKAALIGLGKSLARELGPSGIRVNCVSPGVISTDMNAIHTPETMRVLADDTPLCRIGSPEEVANCVMFLCSNQAAFVTGEVLRVSGGF